MTEDEIEKLNESASGEQIRATETLTTTAPKGAPAEEIREGVKKVAQARAAETLESPVASPAQKSNDPSVDANTTFPPTAAPIPTRSRSRLYIWGRPKPEPKADIAPYPGT